MRSSLGRLGRPYGRSSPPARNVKRPSGFATRSPLCLRLLRWYLCWSNSPAGSWGGSFSRTRVERPTQLQKSGSFARTSAKTFGLRGPGQLRILHPEPDLERDLEVLDLAIRKVPANVRHFKPVEAA